MKSSAPGQQDQTEVMSHGAASPRPKREIVAPRKETKVLQHGSSAASCGKL
jgi:hypothetical protein